MFPTMRYSHFLARFLMFVAVVFFPFIQSVYQSDPVVGSFLAMVVGVSGMTGVLMYILEDV